MSIEDGEHCARYRPGQPTVVKDSAGRPFRFKVKRVYETAEEAQAVADLMGELTERGLTVFHCFTCDHWHLCSPPTSFVPLTDPGQIDLNKTATLLAERFTVRH